MNLRSDEVLLHLLDRILHVTFSTLPAGKARNTGEQSEENTSTVLYSL